MKNLFHSFCVQHKRREGSEVDEKRLKLTFQNCGFLVDEPYRDLDKYDMMTLLDSLVEYSKYGCIIMCILSHGSKGRNICMNKFMKNIS